MEEEELAGRSRPPQALQEDLEASKEGDPWGKHRHRQGPLQRTLGAPSLVSAPPTGSSPHRLERSAPSLPTYRNNWASRTPRRRQTRDRRRPEAQSSRRWGRERSAGRRQGPRCPGSEGRAREDSLEERERTTRVRVSLSARASIYVPLLQQLAVALWAPGLRGLDQQAFVVCGPTGFHVCSC